MALDLLRQVSSQKILPCTCAMTLRHSLTREPELMEDWLGIKNVSERMAYPLTEKIASAIDR